MKELTKWVFWFDAMNDQWRAAKRTDYAELFNNHRSEKVLRSSSIETLQDIICNHIVESDKGWTAVLPRENSQKGKLLLYNEVVFKTRK